MFFSAAKRGEIKAANPDATFGDIVSPILDVFCCNSPLSHATLVRPLGEACLGGVEKT